MNFNNKGLIIFLASVLLAILMLIFSQSRIEAQTFKGTHDTAYIRYLWFYCKKGLEEGRPDLPVFYQALFCDCMLDKVRLSVDKDELENMPSEQRQDFYENISNECTNKKEEDLI